MCVAAISLALPVVSNLFPVSYKRNVKEHTISRPKIAAPGAGEAFNTVWYVEQIAHAALSISAMTNSEVRIMVPRT